MANYITNIWTIESFGSYARGGVLSSFLNKNNHVDFGLIIPMPECLKDFEPHDGVILRAQGALGLIGESTDQETVQGLINQMSLGCILRDATSPATKSEAESVSKAILNWLECGHLYWYTWTTENWGPSSNAHSQPESGHDRTSKSFRFETSSNHPGPVVLALSKDLPEVVFHIQYASEDLGSKAGEYRIKDGERYDENIAPPWREMEKEDQLYWRKFAFGLVYPGCEPAELGYRTSLEDIEEEEHNA